MDRFKLATKLFVGMGLFWVFELIAGVLDEHVSEYVFYFTDTLNLLQGVYVFAIFVCKPAVLADILKFLKLEKYFPRKNQESNMRMTNLQDRKSFATKATENTSVNFE